MYDKCLYLPVNDFELISRYLVQADTAGFVYSLINKNIPAWRMSDSKKTGKSKQKGVKKTIYLDKKALDKIKVEADSRDRSVSYVINDILKKHYGLDKKDKAGE